MNVETCLTYGIHPSPFGLCLLAKSEKGLCHLSLRDEEEELLSDLTRIQGKRKGEWKRNDAALAPLARLIFEKGQDCLGQVVLDLEGTIFQKRVWKALLAIPAGQTTTYSEIAKTVGNPRAVRAVGSAVGDNPICFLIPCHRVLRKDGGMMPNLFAGGGAACGISGKGRDGYLSGNGLLAATVLGAKAGRSAARLVKGV